MHRWSRKTEGWDGPAGPALRNPWRRMGAWAARVLRRRTVKSRRRVLIAVGILCCLAVVLFVQRRSMPPRDTREYVPFVPTDDFPTGPDARKVAPSLLYRSLVYLTFEPETFVEAEGLWIVKDVSGRGHHGVLRGADPVAGGRVGGAIAFDGNDYIDLPTLMAANYREKTGLTVSVWVRETAYKERAFVFQGRVESDHSLTGFNLSRHGKGRCYRFSSPWSEDEYEAENIPVGEWHHIVGVCDRKEISLFVDGKEAPLERRRHSGSLAPTESLESMHARIGSCIHVDSPTPGEYFEGQMDEFLLFGRALADEEVESLYRMGAKDRRPKPPVGSPSIAGFPPLGWNDRVKEIMTPAANSGYNGFVARGWDGTDVGLDEYRNMVRKGDWRNVMTLGELGRLWGFANSEDHKAQIGASMSGPFRGEIQLRGPGTTEDGEHSLGQYRQGTFNMQPEDCAVHRLVLSPDEVWVAVCSQSATVYMYAIRFTFNEEKAQFREMNTGMRAVFTVAFSADSRLLLCGGEVSEEDPSTSPLRLYDLKKQDDGREFKTSHRRVTAVAVSPDGSRILAATGDHLIRLMDMETGNELAVLKGHTDLVTDVVFLPDGTRAVSGSDDTSVRVWDLATGSEEHVLNGHTEPVRTIAVTSDGQLCLSGGLDGVCQLWHVPTGRHVEHFLEEGAPVDAIRVVLDDRMAAVAYRTGIVHYWNLPVAAGIFWSPEQDPSNE